MPRTRILAIALPILLMLLAACGSSSTPPNGEAGMTGDAGPQSDATVDANPCAAIPADQVCSTAGRSCDGATLVDCEADADGCLVKTTTDCSASPGGICDDTGATPMCLLPADPCAAIPDADRCDTVGTQCTDGTTLETCAPDAFGCLVKTPADCSARAGGTCDGTSVPATCTFTSDPCEGVTQCTDHGATRCEGATLVQCRRDAYGCYVDTRDDCTSASFGFCDDSSSTAMCNTAATDPCMGMTQCPTVGATCDGDTLHVCAENAFGCDVEATTDCTASSMVCDASMTDPPACVDPCSLVTTCPAADYCDGADAVHCAPDAHGCMVESSRDTCTATQVCDPASAACVDDSLCPDADRTILTCSTGMISLDDGRGLDGLRALRRELQRLRRLPWSRAHLPLPKRGLRADRRDHPHGGRIGRLRFVRHLDGGRRCGLRRVRHLRRPLDHVDGRRVGDLRGRRGRGALRGGGPLHAWQHGRRVHPGGDLRTRRLRQRHDRSGRDLRRRQRHPWRRLRRLVPDRGRLRVHRIPLRAACRPAATG